MTTQRTALVCLILVEALACAFLSQTWAYPALVALVALLGWRGGWQAPVPQERRIILALVAALLFAVKWRTAPHVLDADVLPSVSPMLHAVGLFLLALQTAALFVTHPGGLLPVTMPWVGVLVMVSTGDRTVTPSQRVWFQVIALAFVVATAAYWSATAAVRAYGGRRVPPARHGRTIAAIVILAGIAAVGWAAATGLHRYERALDQIVAEFLTPEYGASQAGFPTQSHLGSIAQQKLEHAQQIALRVESQSPPGYLRGRAYHWLQTTEDSHHRQGRTEWLDDPPRGTSQPVSAAVFQTIMRPDTVNPNTVRPDTVRPDGAVPGGFRFTLTEQSATHNAAAQTTGARPFDRMTVRLAEPLWGTYFLPIGAAAVITPEDRLRWDYQGLTSASGVATGRYLVQVNPDNAARRSLRDFDTPPAVERLGEDALTAVPEVLRDDPHLRALAAKIFAGCNGSPQCITAVEDYFQTHYRYNIGIQVPHRSDPIRYFLSAEHPPAHCEYFAQAAALLLRMRGIPTRYMTGFVAVEQNAFGGYWLARNEHAHAWCEAWIDGRGWTIAEATPAAGRPVPANPPRYRQGWEYLSSRLADLRQRFAAEGWLWLVRQVVRVAVTPAGGLLGMLALAYILLRVWMRRRARPNLPEPVRRLHRLLRRADRRAARLGLVRRPGETLSQFAARLNAADALLADWYIQYARVRYAGPLQGDALSQLQTRLRSVGLSRLGLRTASPQTLPVQASG